jgi:phospholipid/cholesterol/gamma-HCH transport system substrate-binding protein
MRRVITGLVILSLVTAGWVVLDRRDAKETIQVTASFSRTVGLYPGSSVRVLGVAIGTVTSVKPEGTIVEVVLELPKDTRVPADAKAVIIPPSLVSDRYVQLFPPYDSGPAMADGDAIPLARTRTPVELDEILASLDRLFVALGPKGANADGSLAALIDTGAKTLGNGNGARLNATLTELSEAISTLAAGGDDLAGVIENLSSFTSTLASSDQKVRVLMRDLASVSTQLAGEREILEQALANLAVALGEVASLVRENRDTLGRDVDSLARVTQAVLSNKKELLEALDTAPLQLSNLAMAFNQDRDTLDIRNNNEQGGNIDQILLCQLLGIGCTTTTTSTAAQPAKAVQAQPAAFLTNDEQGLTGLLSAVYR